MTLGQIIIVIIAGMLLAFLLMQIVGYETVIKEMEEDLYYARNKELIDLKDFDDTKHLNTREGILEAKNFEAGVFFIDNDRRVVWRVIEIKHNKKVFHASGIVEAED